MLSNVLATRVFRIAAVATSILADLWSVYSRFDGRRVNVAKAAKKYRGIKSIRHS